MSDKELALFHSDFRELATFIKYGKDKEKMKTAEIANDVTNAKLKLRPDEKGEVDMCVAIMGIREEGVQEGIQKGLQEGIQKGIF